MSIILGAGLSLSHLSENPGPPHFVLEKTTLWDFPKRGDWAVHVGDYRGNWPPQVPRNLIEQFTQPGDLVVDAFVGGGTTLIEAWLLGRPSVGLDISNLALQTSKAKVKEMGNLAKEDDSISLDSGFRPKIYRGNALKLNSILKGRRNEFGEPKLICVHPPYLNSLEYTGGHKDDLALISNPVVFCKKMQMLARQIRKVLADDGVCGVLIGDVRKQGNILPIGFQTLQAFLTCGFELRNLVIKTQHRDRSSEFYANLGNGSLLMAHEYLFILSSRESLETSG